MNDPDRSIHDENIRALQIARTQINDAIEDEPERQVALAYTQAADMIDEAVASLQDAKRISELSFHERVEASLRRVETGQTTYADAVILRSAIQ